MLWSYSVGCISVASGVGTGDLDIVIALGSGRSVAGLTGVAGDPIGGIGPTCVWGELLTFLWSVATGRVEFRFVGSIGGVLNEFVTVHEGVGGGAYCSRRQWIGDRLRVSET